MNALFCLVFGVLLFLRETYGQQAGDVKVVASTIGFDPDNQVPPACFNSSSPSECINDRDFLRILASDNADACSDTPFTTSTTEDVIAKTVIRCLNAVRVQPELLRDMYPCDASGFEGKLLRPRRSLLRARNNEDEESRQPLDRAAMIHASFMRDTSALGHEGPGGRNFVQSITSTGWNGFPVAQAIARGPASVRAFVLGWMCSESNRETLMSCAFDTIGAGAANTPGTTEWFITVQLGCSAFDGDCRCSTVEVVQSPPQLLTPARRLEDGGIQEQSILNIAPEIGEPAVAGDPTSVISPACIFATTPDCVNPRSLIATQNTIDIDKACPDMRLYGSGLSLGEVTNQIEECINAYRIAPNAFESVLPCAYTFREEVTVPQRTPLKVTVQTSDNPVHPLDVSSTGHSRDMANRNYFDHNSLDGRLFSDRIVEEGWKGYPLGENIAAGYQTVRATVLGWVCSAPHRKSLMSCGFDTMGTGVAFNPNSKFKYYYTQNFGCGALSGDCKCGDTIQATPQRDAQTGPSPIPSSISQSPGTPIRLPPQSPPGGQRDIPDASTRNTFDSTSFPDAPPPQPPVVIRTGPTPDRRRRSRPGSPTQTRPPRRQRDARFRDGRNRRRRQQRRARGTSTNSSPPQDPFQEILTFIETSPRLSVVLENADVANVFIRRGVGNQLPVASILGQSQNGTKKSEPRIVGDPLVWLSPKKEKTPRCLVFPGEECAGDVYVAPELVDPEEVCSSAPFNGTDIDIANDIERCANAFRVDPDAFGSTLPCEYTFRPDVLIPPRGPLKRVEQEAQVAEDPLDRASMIHSFDLATSEVLLGHVDFNGKSAAGRLADENVTTPLVGELISAGYQSVQEAVLAWVCSPTHRQVLMSCGFDSFGTGASMDKFSGLQTYITQTFTCSRPDGECTCAPGNASFKEPSDALPSRMMCMVGSSQDDHLESSAHATNRQREKRHRVALPRGIMHTLNAAAIGEGCLPTTIESRLVIAIFLDKEVSLLRREDFEVGTQEALEIEIKPAEEENRIVWMLTVTVPDSFFGVVELGMTCVEPKQTLRVKRITEKEMLDHIIRSSSGERSCP